MSNRSDRLHKWECTKFCVELAGLIVILATLVCYIWLALLQKAANESFRKTFEATQASTDISQKTFASSQCIWVTPEGDPVLSPFRGNQCSIKITIQNTSNLPALHFQSFFQYKDVSSAWSEPQPMWAPVDTEKTLLPQHPYWITGIIASNNPAASTTDIANGKYLFRFTLKYQDTMQRTVEISQTSQLLDNGKLWIIQELTVKYQGITPL